MPPADAKPQPTKKQVDALLTLGVVDIERKHNRRKSAQPTKHESSEPPPIGFTKTSARRLSKMQSYENQPASPRRPVNLTLNTSGYNTRSERRSANSPPRTPSKSRASTLTKTLGRDARGSPRETFLEDITPVDPRNGASGYKGKEERHSHDLNIGAEGTRDSLVDNMLLSLDQFNSNEGIFGGLGGMTADEAKSYSTFADEDYPYGRFNGSGRSGHSRGESEYDAHGHPSHSRESSGYERTRTRRSVSSSNFATTNGKVDMATAKRGGTLPRHKGQGSKGSSVGSFDLGYAQVTSNQRWAPHGASRRRSVSLEGGYSNDKVLRDLARQQAARPESQYDAYEAAPTPTIPTGVRRPGNMTVTTGYAEASPLQSPARPDSKRGAASRNMHIGKRAETSDGPRTTNTSNDANRRLPPLPAFLKDEPTAQQKPKQAMAPPPAPSQKQGFFRRVFGSNRNLNAALTQTDTASSNGSAASRSSESPASNRNPSGQRGTTSHGHPSPQPPPKDLHVVKKTPSSFFRRRKKSLSEEPPMPQGLPLPPATFALDDVRRLDSPTGSLMQAMKPYVDNNGESPAVRNASKQQASQFSMQGRYESNTDDSEIEDLKGFSPGYKPDKHATIRSVDSPRMDITQAFPRSETMGTLDGGLKRQDTEDTDRSFLQDSSDNERTGRVVTQSLTIKDDKARDTSSHSSAAIERDRQQVKEYNQKYAKRDPAKKGASLSLYPDIGSSPGSQRIVRSGEVYIPKEEELELNDDEDVVVSPTKAELESSVGERLRLEPTYSEENTTASRKTDATIRDRTGTTESSQSTPNVWYSATELPQLNVEGADSAVQSPLPIDEDNKDTNENQKPKSSEIDDTLEPKISDRDRAKKIYDGNEDFIQRSKAAAWIGEDGPARARTLLAYMELYNFADLNILAALRMLCGRLVLRAESQQVDRILDAFASRWCACNPNHGFRLQDVVHTICYSLLLLNTDLHMADIENKMTRSQFVKNTIPTILRCIQDAPEPVFDNKRPSVLVENFKNPEEEEKEWEPPLTEKEKKERKKNMVLDMNPRADLVSEEPKRGRGNSLEINTGEKPSWRLSLRPGALTTQTRSNSDGPGAGPTPLKYGTADSDCGPLVRAPFHGTLRTWEVQVEVVLKAFYNTIKLERLPLFGAETETKFGQRQSQSTLSVFGTGMLRRTPSVISKAGSESRGDTRGRTAEGQRLNTGKWSAKTRSRVRGNVYGSSIMNGSRTSFDDNSSSIWSPSALSTNTSTWSKYSLGKTPTTLSVSSMGSDGMEGYQLSIGFASALSQAIIREEQPHPGSRDGASMHMSDSRSIMSGRSAARGLGLDEAAKRQLLDDESLELEGAPWAKEGLVKHKHHLDSAERKSKDRQWGEVFAVVEKGYLTLFSFSSNSKSARIKKMNKPGGAPSRPGTGKVVGGGNWQDNAEQLGQFLLRQTIASALPAPGYSKSRPYVFALSLPTGAVHLFQVGTESIVKEWVSAANYWSARLSNHPLVGGISNINYGWSDAVINTSLLNTVTEASSAIEAGEAAASSKGLPNSVSRTSTSGGRASLQASIRTSLDHGGGFRPKLPADKVTINNWTPPSQSMRASQLSEEEQLVYLSNYVKSVEEDLDRHQAVRGPMGVAVSLLSQPFRPTSPGPHVPGSEETMRCDGDVFRTKDFR